jgi:hypothetical protein
MRGIALWAIVMVVALAYPLSVLARGTPHFPSREECVRPATEDGAIAAVFGYFDSERDAVVMRNRALSAGFQGTEAQGDGCGRVRVAVGGIPSLDVGRQLVKEAHSVGLDVTLEQAG